MAPTYTNRKEIDKAFKKAFDSELKKSLGSKFMMDEIQKEVEKNMGSDANREVVVRICKVYKSLLFSIFKGARISTRISEKDATMKITKRQLRKIIKEERAKLLREAPSKYLIFIPKKTAMGKDWTERMASPRGIERGLIDGMTYEEDDAGIYITDIDYTAGPGRDVMTGINSWNALDSDTGSDDMEKKRAKWAAEEADFIGDFASWVNAGNAVRAGQAPPKKFLNNKAITRLSVEKIIGRLIGAPTSVPERKTKVAYGSALPGDPTLAWRNDLSPHLESAGIEELMALESGPEVEGLVAEFGALSAAQKFALKKIEELGQGYASIGEFNTLLDQVGKENFESAAETVLDTLRQIGPPADDLVTFYNDVMDM